MKRLTLFAKGNVDVHDSLHSCRIGGTLCWNGINDVLRTMDRSAIVRVRHETMTRSDALLHSSGTVPAELERRNLFLGAYPAPSQFSRQIFETSADAIILSLQPDVASGMMRHKTEGYYFYPSEASTWSATDKAWLKSEFESLERLGPTRSMANLASVINEIRATSEAPILIYNLSPIVPQEAIHCYMGIGETLATRIRKFNVALTELSEETGISIVDVDGIVARHGADALKIDAMHLTPKGYELVAKEVVRILDDLGMFEGG